MKIIDISQEFFSCRVYPGDTPPTREQVKSVEIDGYNLTNVSMGVHNGTHIDAPLHFVSGGRAVHELDLSIFSGKCTIAEHSGIISEDDITSILDNSSERLLLKGECELSDEAAVALAYSHVKLVGVESQTIGKTGSPKSIHLTLLKKEIIPLEGLNLSKAEPGEYILSAFPLNMYSSDGSPVRAVLFQGEAADNREIMKCPDFSVAMQSTDQERKLPQPPLFLESKGKVIELSADFNSVISCDSYKDLLDKRRSERKFDKGAKMTQDQLAFLLWSSQGIQKIRGNNYMTLRPVPSGGARHPFETYILVRNVESLRSGCYHYLPQEHTGEKRVSVEFLAEIPDMEECITDMLAGQQWAASAQVIILISCSAYRAEWRYSDMAHRVVLIDQGHVGQNWMLSAASMGLGSCCIAAYNQKRCDEVLKLDGYDEYTVYACAVGVID